MNIKNNFNLQKGIKMDDKNKEVTPRFFQIEKESYYKIAKNLDASDFSNSFTRYSAQLKLLKNLQKDALELNLADEIKEFETEEQNIRAALKEMGVEIKAE